MGRAALLLLALTPTLAWAGAPCGQRSTTSADARFLPSDADLRAGFAVAGAGDVDRDGADDLLVGASPGDGSEAEAAVWLATGGPAGRVALEALPRMGDEEDAELGAALSAAGDVVGDADPDFAIGAPGAEWDEQEDAGAVLVVAGRGWDGLLVDAPSSVILGSGPGQRFGAALAGPLDRDDDGAAEILVGAPGDGLAGSDAGTVYLFEGELDLWMSASAADAMLLGADDGDEAGWSVASGDLDGDGRDDLLVGAPGAGEGGAVYAVLGSVTGVSSLSDADGVALGGHSAALGWSVAGGGDADGDGYDDVLAGAPGHGEGGAALLFSGPFAGELREEDAVAVLFAAGSGDRAGWSVAIPGDADGDERADLLVGAPDASALDREGGAAYLFLGPVAGEIGLDRADGIFGASGDDAGLGISVAGAGDVDGDGLADLLLGAWLDDSGAEDGGGAFLFLGGACDGEIDADRDGWSPPDDCDDAQGDVHPEAEEDPCNGRDDDCDGVTDEGDPEDCDTDEPCEGDDCDTGDTDEGEDTDTAGTEDTDDPEIPLRDGCSCERRGTGGTFSLLAALPLALLARRRR